MTLTRVGEGRWQLASRHGQVVGEGSLYQMVCLWARMRADGWSDLPYGHGSAIEGTECHDCSCRACRRPRQQTG